MDGTRTAPPQQAANGGSMSDRDGTGDDEVCPAEIHEFVRNLEFANHFTRWMAIKHLENEDEWPINSKKVMLRLLEMTGELPSQGSVLTSMNRLESVGALEKEKLKNQSGNHWHTTEYGHSVIRELIALWNEALDCPEAAEALHARRDTDSDDDDGGDGGDAEE